MIGPINCHFCTFDPLPLLIMLAQFMGIVFGMGWFPCCCPSTPPATCNGCTGDVPQQYEVDVSGVVDRDCGTCETFDGLYVADWHSECEWRAPLTTCNYTHIRVLVSGTLVYVYFSKTTAPTHDNNAFRRIYGSNQDCSAFNGESIPHWLDNLGPTDCNATAATVLLTAV